MAENMMLSKNFDKKKVEFPVYLSEKLDGVPGIYTVTDTGVEVMSRQGKPILSTEHIKKGIAGLDFPAGTKIIGEHYILGKPFKYISGKVRQHEPCTELILCIFDVLCENESEPFFDRVESLHKFLLDKEVSAEYFKENNLALLPQLRCLDETTMQLNRQLIIDSAEKKDRKIEGIMYRNGGGTYDYTRSWNCMKEVFEHTIDLKVILTVQAIDKEGNPLQMVGSLVCEDSKEQSFTVSAGKANHKTRTEWFEKPETILNKIVVVKYKPDDTYKEGLRQPTFQHIHEDKTEPDEVIYENKS